MTQRLNYTTIAPVGVKALGGVYAYIAQSNLPAQLVNQVYLRVSQINGCAYCIDMHSRDLLKGGLAVEKLVLVPGWREAGSLFDSREHAALAWAETVTRVADTATVRSLTSSVAPALSRPLPEGSDTMTTISAKSDVITLINIFTVEPANQRRLVELLTEATEVSVRRAPGFVSASLHRSTDGTKVTMYAQWRSIDDYQAMRQDPAP